MPSQSGTASWPGLRRRGGHCAVRSGMSLVGERGRQAGARHAQRRGALRKGEAARERGVECSDEYVEVVLRHEEHDGMKRMHGVARLVTDSVPMAV